MAWLITSILAVPAIVVLALLSGSYEGLVGWECAPADYKYMLSALVPLYYVPICVAIIMLILLAAKVKRRNHMSSKLQCSMGTYTNGHIESGTVAKKKEDKPEEKKKVVKKPVKNMVSTSTVASSYSQGSWDMTSSDGTDYEGYLGKDKDMLIEVPTDSDIMTDEHQSDSTEDYISPSISSSDYEMITSKSSETESDYEIPKVKGKCGKERLNEPLDDMDIHLTLETAELLYISEISGTDNPAYETESETPLADSIQVKHKDGQEKDTDNHSQDSSYGGSEQSECGIKGPRRSILRRDNSRKISKKVQFTIPEGQSTEGKSGKRIRRRPTGMRRKTRTTNLINTDTCHINHVSNGKLDNMQMISSVSQSTIDYMVQVQHSQGVRLSRKVKCQQTNFAVFCVMLFAFGILSMPYMLSYTVLAICKSCRETFPKNLATTFEWMHHASSAVNLLLYILLNPEFRESMANLCGCK